RVGHHHRRFGNRGAGAGTGGRLGGSQNLRDRSHLVGAALCPAQARYSHSIVAGGFELTSYTTRLTPFTSLAIRLEMRPSASGGNATQAAVIPSRLVTARRATVRS